MVCLTPLFEQDIFCETPHPKGSLTLECFGHLRNLPLLQESLSNRTKSNWLSDQTKWDSLSVLRFDILPWSGLSWRSWLKKDFIQNQLRVVCSSPETKWHGWVCWWVSAWSEDWAPAVLREEVPRGGWGAPVQSSSSAVELHGIQWFPYQTLFRLPFESILWIYTNIFGGEFRGHILFSRIILVCSN